MSLGDMHNPFNHQPASTQKGTGTYTCPAGKYARVTVSVSGTAYCSALGLATNSVAAGVSNGSFNESFFVWVKAADTVSFSAQATANASTGLTGAGVISDNTYIEVHHNGFIIRSMDCVATAFHSVSTGTATSTVIGTLNYDWYAEEYNVLT